MVYLYNELAALRHSAEKYRAMLDVILSKASSSEIDKADLVANITAALSTPESVSNGKAETKTESAANAETGKPSAIKWAMSRNHKKVQVFSICPAPELAINTAEFWKTAEAGRAFDLMYNTTHVELEKFFRGVDPPAPDLIRMARVSPEGGVTYLTDF
jgi:hypothetical protein